MGIYNHGAYDMRCTGHSLIALTKKPDRSDLGKEGPVSAHSLKFFLVMVVRACVVMGVRCACSQEAERGAGAHLTFPV